MSNNQQYSRYEFITSPSVDDFADAARGSLPPNTAKTVKTRQSNQLASDEASTYGFAMPLQSY